jgi:hypothetical protein
VGYQAEEPIVNSFIFVYLILGLVMAAGFILVVYGLFQRPQKTGPSGELSGPEPFTTIIPAAEPEKTALPTGEEDVAAFSHKSLFDPDRHVTEMVRAKDDKEPQLSPPSRPRFDRLKKMLGLSGKRRSPSSLE